MPSFSILLVDDDFDIYDIVQRAINNVFPEAELIHMFSYEQATNFLKEHAHRFPSIALLDIDLQARSNGFDFLRVLRSSPKGRLTPAIMLTASADPRDIDKAYEAGANAYTQKPFSYSDWLTYMQQLRTYWYETASLPKKTSR